MYNQFYSHGKLLLTGEYFVLEGASAFAVPLKLGQSMIVNRVSDDKGELVWETTVKNKPWFRAQFDLNNVDIKETTHQKSASYIQVLLKNIKQNSNVLATNSQSIHIKANLEFDVEWGLGSSSSLITNLAKWSALNPYDMLFQTSKGSGYDIACAQSETPIIYQNLEKPILNKVSFNPNFLDNIYFVYLGKKQDSLLSIEMNWDKIKGLNAERERISEIGLAIVKSENLTEFEGYISEHEEIISKSLDIPTVKSRLFSNFYGAIKSLGAWGGDFIMVTHRGNREEVVNYFRDKELNTIFSYKELVL